MKKVPLLQEDKLTNIIEQLKETKLTDGQIDYLKDRWLHQVVYWDWRSRWARCRYFILRAVTICGSVAIPVCTSLAITYPTRIIFSLIATVLGSLVAASAAWEGVANYGQIWLEKRKAGELLKVEGMLFFELAEPYATGDHATVFNSFVLSVEKLIGKEVGDYVATIDASVKKKIDDLLNASKTGNQTADNK